MRVGTSVAGAAPNCMNSSSSPQESSRTAVTEVEESNTDAINDISTDFDEVIKCSDIYSKYKKIF